MATTRGFVERIEVGRGGLVRVTLVNETGRLDFTVSDIDGDPERFNERLTKVSILRDAMNRAEPVEVEHNGGGDNEGGDSGGEIVRVARVSREQLLDTGVVSLVGGLVLKLVIESRNDVDGTGEAHDNAQITLIGLDGDTHEVRLDLQAPERLVAAEQLRLLRDAHDAGAMVQLLVATSDEKEGRDPEIVSVWVSDGSAGRGGEGRGATISGFVESLGTMLPAVLASASGSLALTRITTGPEHTGVGGTVDPEPFTPETLGFFVARGSVVYSLLEAAVRENVRVRVRYLSLLEEDDDPDRVVARHPSKARRAPEAPEAPETPEEYEDYEEYEEPEAEVAAQVAGLLLSAELQAPLSSASRPVWVQIDREMLDRGPDSDCVPGLPATSLRTRTLRDLRIPYPAEWIGHGCFNHGVYRFQLVAPVGSVISVDGEPICLFPAGQEDETVVGYACLEGDHVVTVQIPEYVCDTEFDLDVYRVR